MEIVLLILAAAAYGVYKIFKTPINLNTSQDFRAQVEPDFMALIDAEMGYPLFPHMRPKAAPILRDITPRQTEDDAQRRREAFIKANPDLAADMAAVADSERRLRIAQNELAEAFARRTR